jgi:hypothetical protein
MEIFWYELKVAIQSFQLQWLAQSLQGDFLLYFQQMNKFISEKQNAKDLYPWYLKKNSTRSMSIVM